MYVRSLRGIRGSGEPASWSRGHLVVRPVLAHARRQQGARIMTEQAASSRLGRGLAALIGDDDEPAPERRPAQRKIPVAFLRPNPRNPRKHFKADEIEALAGSIRQRGIVQPILVRPVADQASVYEIVAGERRWRAAQVACLHEVPVVVVEVDDRTSLEYALIENVQRADLNPIEEATGYRRLMDEFGYSYADLAQILGKSRPHVTNMIRLLDLPPEVKDLVVEGRITAGHARALLVVPDPVSVAHRIVETGLSVRAVEAIAQTDPGSGSDPKPRRMGVKDADTRAVEQMLEDVLGLAVTIHHRGQSGEVRIRYKALDQLDGLCRRLRG
jgi:ParB family transcriptional regulator, chromosome partitioning protein